MNLYSESDAGVLIVRVEEKSLDVNNVQSFLSAFEVFKTPGAKIVLDLSQLNYIDSSACGAMLTCLRQLTSAGGGMKLCSASTNVRAILNMVRINRVFDMHASPAEAVARYAAPAAVLS